VARSAARVGADARKAKHTKAEINRRRNFIPHRFCLGPQILDYGFFGGGCLFALRIATTEISLLLAEVKKTETREARLKRIEPVGVAFQMAFLGEAARGHFEDDPILGSAEGPPPPPGVLRKCSF